MVQRRKVITPEQRTRVLAELRRDTAQRNSGYRERALRLFPHICAACAREFSGRNLKELTVHHKDHNHNNNPPDGSNWELLCVYCHDHEHEKLLDAKHIHAGPSSVKSDKPGLGSPFEQLDTLVKPEQEGTDLGEE